MVRKLTWLPALLLPLACPGGGVRDAASTNDASTAWDVVADTGSANADSSTGDTSSARDVSSAGDVSSARDVSSAHDVAARSDSTGSTDAGVGQTLSDDYPGDQGMANDPAVVWMEDCEEGSLASIKARYDQVRDNGRIELTGNTPNGSGSALALRASTGVAVDLYKSLPSSDEWWVRWYVNYEAGVTWHHNGMWIGGYNPSQTWPSPGAGTRPQGNDRFSIAVEPMNNGERFEFYNYWMRMHSWMETPVDNGSAYWGNTLIHNNSFTVDAGNWVCLEVHVKVNSDLSSGTGAVLEVWKNDTLVQRFDETGPLGYWIRDKFCPAGADDTNCTNYPAPATEVLDLQQRNTAALQLNHFWPQNYDANGTVVFDQMVVATRRVGCMR